MKIEIEISEKLSEHVDDILEYVKAQNKGAEVSIEMLASHVLKQQLIQLYSQILSN